MKEIRAALVAFTVVFVSYGFVASFNAAVVGPSFGVSASKQSTISRESVR